MLCKNCGRHVDINKNRCKCGRNPFGEDKNNFDVIERILNSEEQDIHNVHISPPNVRDCTKRGGNDGAIYDIDERLEVSIDNGVSFETAPGKVMSGLPAGNYIFRDKENYGLIFNLTVEEPKSHSFLIAAIVVPVCLVLVIAAGIIGLPKLPSISLPKDDKKTTSSSAEASSEVETTEMIVYGLDESIKGEDYLPIVESLNTVKNGTTIYCYDLNEDSDIAFKLDKNSEETYHVKTKYRKYLFIECEDEKTYYAKKEINIPTDVTSRNNNEHTCSLTEKFKIKCENKEYYGVICRGKRYYILKETFIENFSENKILNEAYYIKYDNNKEYIAMYEKADTECEKYEKIEPDGNEPIKVTAIGEEGDFYYVKYNGKTGYILKDKLTKSKQKATTSANTTTMTTSGSIVTLPSASSYYNNYNNNSQPPANNSTNNPKLFINAY